MHSTRRLAVTSTRRTRRLASVTVTAPVVPELPGQPPSTSAQQDDAKVTLAAITLSVNAAAAVFLVRTPELQMTSVLRALQQFQGRAAEEDRVA